MTKTRVAVEFGMGTALRSEDPTQACVRAVKDALWHNSLTVAQAFGQSVQDMMVDVELACQEPDRVDIATVKDVFPYGQIGVTVMQGGLNVPKRDGGYTIVAHAAVVVSLDLETS
ncbi:MAG: Lin0512 family protein [Pseudomonadota bacterium]